MFYRRPGGNNLKINWFSFTKYVNFFILLNERTLLSKIQVLPKRVPRLVQLPVWYTSHPWICWQITSQESKSDPTTLPALACVVGADGGVGEIAEKIEREEGEGEGSFSSTLPPFFFPDFPNPSLCVSYTRLRPHVSRCFRIHNLFFPDSKISPSTRYRIRCEFTIFHSGERIKNYPDSPDACGRKAKPERKSCGLKDVRIRVDGA